MLTRILTGIVLIAIALAALWFGGNVFAGLAAIAALLMFAEWAAMFRLGRTLRSGGMAVIALAGVAAIVGLTAQAVMLLGGGAALLLLFARRLAPGRGVWLAAGTLYCGLPLIALIWLRGLPNGLYATLWTLATVWAADIFAYFAGRAIGGPKLLPSVSPNKTWAGAAGGVIGAALIGGGLTVAYLARPGSPYNLDWFGQFTALAAAFAVLSVLGDLFESALKRRAGVKDSGTILPGHGGVLDRLDGLVPVACASALFFAATGWAG